MRLFLFSLSSFDFISLIFFTFFEGGVLHAHLPFFSTGDDAVCLVLFFSMTVC